MRQISLLPAGAQPWNFDIVAVKDNRFAYCATLAIYIYEYDTSHREFRLHSIMTEHKKTIMAISWHCKDPDLLASAGFDLKVLIWHVSKQCIVAKLENMPHLPQSIQWDPRDDGTLFFCSRNGPLVAWKFCNQTSKSNPETIPNSSTFQSEIYRFRINPKVADRVVFGHKNGTISLLNKGAPLDKHILPPDPNAKGDQVQDDPCLGLEWDPRSIDYLLIANQFSGIRLIDSVNKLTITRFKMPTSAVETQAVSWVPTGPGVFVSGDGKAAILRIWNVSKDTPLENVKLRKAGFQALVCFTTPDDEEIDVDVLLEQSQAGSYFAKFPARILCTFNDGGVGLYNLRLRKWEFLRDLGHVETIFDCKFAYEQPDHLATASFDGTIKVWDVRDWSAVANSGGNEGIIYSISWCPGEGIRRLVAATAKHGSFIWDIDSSKVIKRFQNLHAPGKSIYCISWNPRDQRAIASCGADNVCVVHTPDGEVLARFVHPAGVFGCDWSPSSRDMLATACEDGKIRVFYAIPSPRPNSQNSSSEAPIRIFSGHTAKVFGIKWSPLRDGIFASVSDDKTVRIWDYTRETPLLVLEGHEAPTRGIVWNTEIPWLLVSGSWDASLRCWDIRFGGRCIAAVRDHGADVYGLAVHPSRPFVLASTSRDSTVRLWALSWLAERALLPAMAEHGLEETFADPQKATNSDIESTNLNNGGMVLMSGFRSRSIRQDLEVGRAQQTTDPTQLRENFLKELTLLFGPPGVTANLWSLAQVLVGVDDSLLPQDYRRGIVNHAHIIKFRESDAWHIERSQSSGLSGRPQSAQRASQIRDEKLREAADLHMQCGNLSKYCELLLSLGEWERAISVAPGVSRDYWQDLCRRFIAFTLKNGDVSAALPYAIAAGVYEEVLRSLLNDYRTADGLLLAQIAVERGPSSASSLERNNESKQPRQGSAESAESANITALQRRFTDQHASFHLRNGSPISAACCFMAAEQPVKAICALVRGYELELAITLGTFILSNFARIRDKLAQNNSGAEESITDIQSRISEIVKYSAEILALRCINFKNPLLAVDLLLAYQCSEAALFRICSLSALLLSHQENNNNNNNNADERMISLLKRANLPDANECLRLATSSSLSLKSNIGTTSSTAAVIKCVQYYLLSSEPIRGLELGLDHVLQIMSRDDWTISDIFDLIYTMGTIRTDVLQEEANSNVKLVLLTLSAYAGALVAIRRLYLTIVSPLFDCCIALLKKNPEPIKNDGSSRPFPLTEMTIQAEKCAWIRHIVANASRPSMSSGDDVTYEKMLRRIGIELPSSSFPAGVGIFSTTGCHLPSHSETHRCLFTGQPIKGIPFTLEDGVSTISHCDALMWAVVNRFSPLRTGVRINPF